MNDFTHELKTDHEPFAAILSGEKTHEIRQADRDFKVGDTLVLKETRYSRREMFEDGRPLEYTGRTAERVITHIQRGYGLPDGIVVMSLSSALATEGGEADNRCPDCFGAGVYAKAAVLPEPPDVTCMRCNGRGVLPGNLAPQSQVDSKSAESDKQEAVNDLQFRSRTADLLHLLSFAKIETPSAGDAPQAQKAMADLRAMLRAHLAQSAEQDRIDAERYRWLRDRTRDDRMEMVNNTYPDMDAFIDAAIARERAND